MSIDIGCVPEAPPPPPPPLSLNKAIYSDTLLDNVPIFPAVGDYDLYLSAFSKEKCSIKLKEKFSSLEIESRKACKYLLHYCGLQKSEEHIFISSYLPVTPVLQNGPRCGLVALSMASELTNSQPVSTEQIFQKAQDRGYSKQGEMFAAQGLEKLCTHFLTCRVRRIQSNEDEKLQNLICSFLKKNLVLIPYDSDKDHSPCKKKGHKAHWALLTGIFTMLKSKDVPDWLTSHCERDSEMPYLYYWLGGASSVICDRTTEFLQQYCDNMHVFGHHGKSKYAGLWPVQELLISNNNLVEIGPDRNSEEYVIPTGGIETGLRGQFIIIDRNSDSAT